MRRRSSNAPTCPSQWRREPPNVAGSCVWVRREGRATGRVGKDLDGSCVGAPTVCAELMGATARRPDSVCSLTKETWTYGRAVFAITGALKAALMFVISCRRLQPSCASWSHSCSTCARGLSRVQSDLSNLSRTALLTLGVRASMSTPNSEVASRRRHKAGQFKTQPTTRSLTTHALPWLVILHLGHLHLTVTQTGEFDIPSPSDF